MATIVVLVIVVCLPVWPGIYTIDSLAMIEAAHQERISDWYAPLHGWIWGFLDACGAPVGTFFALGVTGFVVATHFVFRQLLPGRWAMLGTTLVVLYPPVYGLLGWVGRDVWFAGYFMAIIGLALLISRNDGRHAVLIAVLAAIAGLAAADARQNAIPVVLLAAAIAGAALSMRRPRPRGRASFIVISGLSAAAIMGTLMLGHSIVVERDQHPEQPLYVRDLVALSIQRGELMLDETLFPAQDLTLLDDTVGDLDYHAPIAFDPLLVAYEPYAADAVINDEYRRQWWSMIRSQPLYYLSSRAEHYAHTIGIGEPVMSPFFGRSDFEAEFELYAQRFPGLADLRLDVLSFGMDSEGRASALFAPAWYLVASIACVAGLIVNRRHRRQAVVLALVLLAMQLLLFFTVTTRQFRYQYFQVVISTVMVVAIALASITASWPRWRREVAAPRSAAPA